MPERSSNRDNFLAILGFYNAFVLDHLEKPCFKKNRTGKCIKRSALNTAPRQYSLKCRRETENIQGVNIPYEMKTSN